MIGQYLAIYNYLKIWNQNIEKVAFKVPLLWLMKGSYLVFGVPNNRVDMRA